ncbi:hypothetical protein BBO99_00007226 [Phytophthora kernoviae]|uniref:Uncharacterized protein n=2 Tax=Phytophthora kernoviae TaxID=325452 RepID=A0A3R7J497_9STRA|nr:hypothetical protein G195_010106 [Phytophthora kernoviae 00238/432]KAG2518519.1 hypothetical protein JM16_006831 [Phytophthora kernoviae]KAG2520183.1 hypothetical protein JM18_006749 [Phytophthora kernoviae]RLM96936.1 hypothetical protein BBI17_007229 [Phytophthora kernoviae]RLN76839.1 hypothetical protein BBO99_00007226 [Phytophthora kernoviae]
MILTDGKAVSIVMRKPKREVVKRPQNEKDYDIMWDLDPGRKDLFVATNQFGEKISCSTPVRNMLTKKTAALGRLEEYVRFMIPRMDMLLTFQMTKPFRKLRFRRNKLAKKL